MDAQFFASVERWREIMVGPVVPDEAARGEVLVAYLTAANSSTERTVLGDLLVEIYSRLIHSLAKRYANHGVPIETLDEVAHFGFANALCLFDLDRFGPHTFFNFVTSCITGEIKRYFRDSVGQLTIPRSLKEERIPAVMRARQDFAAQNHHQPTTEELAEASGLSPGEVTEALTVVHQTWNVISLDWLATRILEGEVVGAPGIDDPGYDFAESHVDLRHALLLLPERERLILLMRFVQNQTLAKIGAEFGINRMYVSRLIARSLAALREAMIA